MQEVTGPAPERVGGRTRRAALLTLGFLLLQAVWIVTIPPFRGSDEFDHAYRAAAVAGGDWVATEPARDGRGLLVEAPRSLVEAAGAQCSILNYTGPDNCDGAGSVGEQQVLVASGAATYFPGYYAVVGVFGEMATGAQSLYAMRIASALVCAAFFFAAAWSASRRAGPWPLAALALAASPVLAYSTAIVAPNGIEMVAALALWCSLMALGGGAHRSEESRLIAIATGSAVALCLLRLLGPAFVLAIVVTVLVYRRRALWSVVTLHLKQVAGGAVLVAAAVTVFGWWLTGPASVPVPDNPDGDGVIDPVYAVLWPLQSIAAFPYRNQPGPLVIYGVVGALVIGLLVLGLRVAGAWERVVIVAALVGALVLPFIATLLTSEGRGVIWQGRYGLAFAVGFIILCGWAVAESPRPARLPPLALVVTVAVYGGALCACYLKVRTEELADNPASLADAAWWVPTPVLVVAAVAVAMVSYGAAMSQRGAARV